MPQKSTSSYDFDTQEFAILTENLQNCDDSSYRCQPILAEDDGDSDEISDDHSAPEQTDINLFIKKDQMVFPGICTSHSQ